MVGRNNNKKPYGIDIEFNVRNSERIEACVLVCVCVCDLLSSLYLSLVRVYVCSCIECFFRSVLQM